MTSAYTEITDGQERMMIVDVYIIGSIGISLSMMILCSLSKQNHAQNDSYYNYAIKLGIISSICCILFYLLKLIFNDLVFPIDKFMINNLTFVSLNDSFLIILWCIEKLAVYYGFTFLYLSLFNKKQIDLYLRILMIYISLITAFYCIFYLINDVLVVSSKEIGISTTRGIYSTGIVNTPNSFSIVNFVIVGLIAILSDFIYVGVLLYRYIYDAKHINNNNNYNRSDAIKCIVLVTISSAAMLVIFVPVVIGSDLRYLSDNFQLVIDNACLFLMFKYNEEIYNSLCGCLCDKTKFRELQVNDQDDTVDDSDVDSDMQALL